MRNLLPLICLISLFSSGCFLNPYKSDFTCPHLENGKCTTVQNAYDESLESTTKKNKADMSLQDELNDMSKSNKAKKNPVSDKTTANYQESLLKKLTGLLGDPVTPMVAPPQVMRVLLFPYRGEGNKLYMPRYVYFFLEDQPQFIFDQKTMVMDGELK